MRKLAATICLTIAVLLGSVRVSWSADFLRVSVICLTSAPMGHTEVIASRRVFGQEVNAASKLGADTADGDEIFIPGALREALGEFPGISYEPLNDVPESTAGGI